MSVRALLLLMTAVCVILAAWTNSVRQQQRAVARIQQLGGSVYYDYQFEEPGSLLEDPVRWRGVLRRHIGDHWFGHVSRVFLDGTPATDADLAAISGLKHVKNLHLNCSKVTPAGLRHLHGWRDLESLELYGPITDDDLKLLTPFENLRRLVLDNTQVTGAGFAHLRHCRNLYHVSMERTPLTPPGLANLREIGVVSIDLWGIEETPALLEELHKFEKLEFVEWALHGEEFRRLGERFPDVFIYSP